MAAIGAPGGLPALLCPVVMLLLLLYVTGVRPSEEQAIKSRGRAYAEYQAVTNRFVPGPRRHAPPTPRSS